MLLLTLGTPLQAAEKAASPQYKPGEKLPAAKARPAQGAYVETTWEALVPKNWNPMEAFKDMKLDRLQDGDPRANEALNKLRDIWDNAPGEPSLNNRKISDWFTNCASIRSSWNCKTRNCGKSRPGSNGAWSATPTSTILRRWAISP